MSDGSEQVMEIGVRALAVAAEMNADVLLINSVMSDECADKLRSLLASASELKRNVFVILVTNGGDAHAAYTMARLLQRSYEHVTICVSGSCYSAGTLMVLGAHSLVMTDDGKLGPLDVQLLKRDALGERLSGMTMGIALHELTDHAFDTFDSMLGKLIGRFRGQLSLKFAIEVASKMTTELYSQVFCQIDPIKLGEDARALHIADHYGRLLEERSKNLKVGTIKRLVEDYPAHDCFIDRDEAESLFVNVFKASDEQQALIEALDEVGREPAPYTDTYVLVLSEYKLDEQEGNNEQDNQGTDETESRTPGGSNSPQSKGATGPGIPEGGNGTADAKNVKTEVK